TTIRSGHGEAVCQGGVEGIEPWVCGCASAHAAASPRTHDEASIGRDRIACISSGSFVDRAALAENSRGRNCRQGGRGSRSLRFESTRHESLYCADLLPAAEPTTLSRITEPPEKDDASRPTPPGRGPRAGADPNAARYAALAARVASDPASYPDARALARADGSSVAAIESLLVRHAHLFPSAWLRRRRVAAAAELLPGTRRPVRAIAPAPGFTDDAAFRAEFLAEARMPPEDYRRLGASAAFSLELPARYRTNDVLAYHGRDPASPSEKVQGMRLLKAVALAGRPTVLEIELGARRATCRVHDGPRPGAARMRAAHAVALRLLGLTADVRAFEARARRDPMLAPLVARRPGLHLPLTATTFDGLCWAIIGQQINLAFAC